MTKELEEKVEETKESKEITKETKETEIQPAPQKIEEKKKKNPLLVIVAVLIVIALLAVAFIFGTKFANKENEVNKEQQYTLDIYEFTYGICEKESTKCKKIDSIPVKTKEAKILTSYEESEDDTYYHVKHILYNYETLKLYSLETKKITETNLKAEYDKYELQMSYDSKEVLGIILYKDSSNSNDYNVYYDIKNQKKLLESQYDQIYAMRGEYIQVVKDQNDIIDEENLDWENAQTYVINTKTQQKIITENNAQTTFSSEQKNNKVYIFRRYPGIHEPISAVYNEQGQNLTNTSVIGHWGFTKDGNIYRVNNNKIEIVNYENKVISTGKEYKNILHVEKEEENFILYDDGKSIYITDESNYTLKLMEKKKEMFYLADWYGSITEDNLNEETIDEKIGLYFTFLYKEDTDLSPGVKIYFNPKTKEIEVKEFKDLYGSEE